MEYPCSPSSALLDDIADTAVVGDADKEAESPEANVGRGFVHGLALVTAILYSAYGCWRYSTFRSAGYDLGIFDQAIRHYASFEAPVAPIKGVGFNILGDHFHPIIALCAPLYWIWADPRMLQIALGVLLALSIYPVYGFTARKLGVSCARVVAVGYAFWWPFQTFVDFDFHEIAFGVPILAVLIDNLDRRRYGRVFACAGALLLVREDMGLLLIMVALIMAGRRQFKLAGAMAALGIGGYVIVTAAIIPQLAPNGKWLYWQYPALGSGPLSSMGHVIAHPISTLALLFSAGPKRALLAHLYLPVGLLGLASPISVIALPILLERLFNERENLWGPSFHYNAILAPVLVMAMVDSMDRIGRALAGRTGPRGVDLRDVTRWAPAVVLSLSVLVGTALGGPYKLHQWLIPDRWSTTAEQRDQARAVALVPRGVCVEADDRLIPHLLRSNWVTTPLHSDGRATWLLVDTSQKNTGGTEQKPQQALNGAAIAGFSRVAEFGDIVVLQRPGPVDPRCVAAP